MNSDVEWKVDEARIAIFLPSLGGGGAERVFVNLANEFVARGLSVDMVLISARGPYLSLLHPGVRVVDLAASKITSVWALARYLRRERPDVLLSAMDVFNVVASVAKRLARVPVPLVLSSHNHMSERARNGRLHHKLVPYLVRLLYPSASGVIAVSSGVAEDLVQSAGLSRENIQVIYNPVATRDLLDKAQGDPGHSWLTPDSPPVILAIGRLIEQKDYPTLFRAFARVLERTTVRLIVLGEGPERESLARLARDLKIQESIDMPGFVGNPFSYLARARLFILPSKYEGFGLVLVEALACGCPVVSTDCPSGPAEILEQGRFGKLVPVGDVDAMADAIVHNLAAPHDPEHLKRRAGDFAVETIATRYLDVLSGSMGRTPGRDAAGVRPPGFR